MARNIFRIKSVINESCTTSPADAELLAEMAPSKVNTLPLGRNFDIGSVPIILRQRERSVLGSAV